MNCAKPMLVVTLAGLASCAVGCGGRPDGFPSEFDGTSNWGLELYFKDADVKMNVDVANRQEAELYALVKSLGRDWPEAEIKQELVNFPVLWRSREWVCSTDNNGKDVLCDGELYWSHIVVAAYPGCENKGAYSHELLHILKSHFDHDSDPNHVSQEFRALYALHDECDEPGSYIPLIGNETIVNI